MIFEDSFVVRAPIGTVWAFLRDPERVARCIPGAEKVDVIDDRTYHVVAGARVSFLSVSFDLRVVLTEVDEPRRLVSRAEGMDPRLKERLRLTSALDLEAAGPADTTVRYHIDVQVYGKLASIGFTVIKGKARQMATEFAQSVRTTLEAPEQGGQP
jgi:carbon monoxide dehydrogenase subunit G